MISAGGGFVEGEEEEDFDRHIQIPTGDYQVNLYTMITGPSGELVFTRMQEKHGQEPLGAWFRRTRPRETFPSWLADWCYENPAMDPGHENQWQEEDSEEDCYDFEDEESEHEPTWVDYLIQLLPLKTDLPFPPLEVDREFYGQEYQKPKNCPRGIKPVELWDPNET